MNTSVPPVSAVGQVAWLLGLSIALLASSFFLYSQIPDSNPTVQVPVSGIKGSQGPKGAIGAVGLRGGSGARGPQGLIGARGPSGSSLPSTSSPAQDIVGATGPNGPTGAAGVQGAVGVDLFPTGTIIHFAGSVVPSGWLPCDGAEYTIVAQPALFNVIGYLYGSINPLLFNVPDLRRRQIRTAPYNGTIATTGGSDTVTLTSNNVPPHNHTITDAGHAHEIDAMTQQNQSIVIASNRIGNNNTVTTSTETTGVTINNSVSANDSFSVANSYVVLQSIIKS